jgi:uncharacterized membrane protein SpoIIM required for sporulation
VSTDFVRRTSVVNTGEFYVLLTLAFFIIIHVTYIYLLHLQAPTIATQLTMKEWLETNSLTNSSRTISLPADWSSNSSIYINQNYVGLEIALGTYLVTSYTQSAALSWTDVISNVGGQTGL